MKTTETHPELNRTCKLIGEMLDGLSKKWRIPIPNREHLMLDLFNMSYICAGQKEGTYYLPFILFDQKKYFIEAIEKEYPEFIQTARQALLRYGKKAGFFFSPFGMNELLYTLIIQWQHLLMEWQKQKRKVKLVIVSHYDLEHGKMVQDFLQIYFPEKIQCVVYEKTKLSEKELTKLDYDLIVSTTSLKKMNTQKTICIQNVPSEKDLAAVHQAIEECLQSECEKIQ